MVKILGESGAHMGPVPATIRRIRVCDSSPIFGYTPIRATPEFGLSTLWLVSTPEVGDTIYAAFMIPTCYPQTWEHVSVMAGTIIIMLDVGGIGGAGKHQLGRLKNP
jgi:hypothetical protein